MKAISLVAPVSALFLFPSPCLALPVTGDVGIAASPLTIAVESEVGIAGTPFTVNGRMGTMGSFYSSAQSLSLNFNGNWLSLWGQYNLPLTPSSTVGLFLGASQSWFYDLVPIPFRTEYMRPQPFETILGCSFRYDWEEVLGLAGLSLSVSPSVAITTPPRSDYHMFDFFEAGMLGPALIEVSAKFKNGVIVKLRPSITPVSLAVSI